MILQNSTNGNTLPEINIQFINAIVIFHTHAKFVHNDEIEKN